MFARVPFRATSIATCAERCAVPNRGIRIGWAKGALKMDPTLGVARQATATSTCGRLAPWIDHRESCFHVPSGETKIVLWRCPHLCFPRMGRAPNVANRGCDCVC